MTTDSGSTTDRSQEMERRRVTIVNCDLVGSTELADQLDAEDYEVVYNTYNDVLTGSAQRYGGEIGRDTGDGVEIYFGCQPTESPGTDAIQCGLHIVTQMPRLVGSDAKPLGCRVGICTGVVVYQRAGPKVFGVTAHRAARIQSLAGVNSVFCDETTRDLAVADFEFQNEGEFPLKGLQIQETVWSPLTARPPRNRFLERLKTELVHRHPRPLVGRNHELAMLRERWQLASDGEGQFVMISGEAGIGKSRLVHELLSEAQTSDVEPITVMMQATAHGVHSPLLPFLPFVAKAARIQDDDSDKKSRSKLHGLFVVENGANELVVDILADYLGIPVENPDRLPDVRGRTHLAHEALVSVFARLADESPLILVVEDVHWLDATSFNLLVHLAGSVAAHRILVLVTTREGSVSKSSTEDPARLPLQAGIMLGRLGRSHKTELMANVAGNALDTEALGELSEKTMGVPLFLEETVKWWIGVAAERPDHAPTGTTSPVGDIPQELIPLLMSRLDSVGPARELAKIAAVAELDVSAELLSRACGRSVEDVEPELQELVDSQLLVKSADKSYRFAHALLKGATYEIIPRRARAALHEKIGDVLQKDYPDVVSKQPEVIAHHLSVASQHSDDDDLRRRAARSWLDAGRHATRTGACAEAVVPLRRGIELALMGPQADTTLLFEMHLELGDACRALGHAHVDDYEAAYGKAIQYCEQLYDEATPDERLRFAKLHARALNARFGAHLNAARLPQAVHFAEQLVALRDREDGKSAHAAGLQSLGIVHCIKGELRDAHLKLTQAVELGVPFDPKSRNVPSMGIAYLGLVKALQGDAVDAVRLCDEAIRRSREEHSYDMTTTLGNTCYAFYLTGDSERVHRNVEELTELAERDGLFIWQQMAQFFSGWLVLRNGNRRGLGTMRDAQSEWGDSEIESSFFLGALGEQALNSGDLALAKTCLEKGLAHHAATGEAFYLAGIHCLSARLIAESDKCERRAIADALAKANEIADRQGALHWSRLATSLRVDLLGGNSASASG